MADVVLIPGYATELASAFRSARGADGGFGAFAGDVAAGRAVVYRWGVLGHAKWHHSINPFYFLRLYRRERALACAHQTLEALHALLQQESPTQIVCHSMGCLLLVEYLKKFVLPASVERIVFVQADIDANTEIVSTVPLTNVHCPWDPTLALSSLHHRQLRAGLVGLRQADNHHFSLRLPVNLHTSSIRDSRLRRMIFPE